MATKREREKNNLERPTRGLHRETARGIWAIVLFLAAGILALSAFGGAGMVRERVFSLCGSVFGVGYLFLPALAIVGGLFLLRSLPALVTRPRFAGAVLLSLAGLGLADLLRLGGGVVGAYLTEPLLALFDLPATLILLSATAVIALLLIIDAPLTLPISGFSFGLSGFPWLRRQPARPLTAEESFDEFSVAQEREEEWEG